VCGIFEKFLYLYLFHLPSDLYRYGSSHRIHKSTRKCAEHLSHFVQSCPKYHSVCSTAGPKKVQVSSCRQNGPRPPHPHKTLPKPWFICQHIATAQFSQQVLWFETELTLFIAYTGVNCGLKYQHWPLKRTLIFDHKFFQWSIVPIKFRQN
jgi:hypothetical protein